jgi:hypothetical protein
MLTSSRSTDVGSKSSNNPHYTVHLPPSPFPREASSIIVAQRKNHHVSPHLSIYKLQITSFGSSMNSMNRITGTVLSGGIAQSVDTLTTGTYLFGTAYLVSPLLGWHLDVPTMTARFSFKLIVNQTIHSTSELILYLETPSILRQ